MYGFHKKVGLSDNSMKASETKAKAPSEYYNKYFKRGRSELLWLIQKPKNPGPAPKRKRDDDIKQGDSDEERRYAPDGGGGGSGNYGDDRLAVRNQSDVAVIPKAEYNNLRSEVRALQQQQKVISNILTQIKQQNDQLYRQAEAFRNLHDRHENSISAILTFLATFYNRSVEANGGANIADLFAASNTQQQPQGSVVDIGDYPDKPFKDTPPVHRPARRPLALLPAPTQKDALSPADRAATISPSIRSAGASPIPKSATRPQVFKPSAAQASTVPPASAGFESQGVSDRTSVPIKIDNTERLQPSDGFPEADEVMSAIQNVNSSQPGNQSFDFPTALSNYQTQGGNAPLTQQERNSVLSLMANNTSAASPNSALAQNSNNALANPHPPDMPSLDQFVTTQAQLDMLQKMSETQGAHIHQLQERLQPLSPSGSIPGLSENSYFPGGQLDDLDLDAFTQGDDFFPDTTQGPGNVDTGDGTLPDLDFQLNQYANPDDAFGGFDGTAEESERKKVESVSSEATSPAMTVEEVDEDGDNKRTPKRRRK
ncbi:hypothetical protein EJ04DRAFT_39911 [Polyplosphaeria fusca]|uniref:Uncharacterized protein n=1 Tax=Polyplosphaeria fusca TaxID=682080 RepID=A0A9P4R814_9PLEO|nr:hypothetical protein EJ04DRAFT_39911 [Polyplosphaeria fusca]